MQRLQQEVQSYLDGFATLAENASLFRQCVLLFNRNKKEAAVLTGAFLMLVAIAAGFMYSLNQEKRQAQSARDDAQIARVDAVVARDDAIVSAEKANEATVLANDRAETIRQQLYFAEMRDAGNSLKDGGGSIDRRLANWSPRQGEQDTRGWEWDFLKKAVNKEILKTSLDDAIRKQDWSPDGTRLAVVTFTDQVHVIELDSGKSVKLFSTVGGQSWTHAVAWSPDGSMLAIAGTPEAGIYDAKTGKLIQALVGHKELVREIRWNSAGTKLLSCSDDGTARIWDTDTGEALLVLTQPQGVSGAQHAAAWSPDGLRCAVAGIGECAIWDSESGKRLLNVTGLNGVYAMDWSPDAAHLAASGADQKIHIVNTDTGETVREIQAHNADVRSVSWSPDGNWLLSCSDDWTSKIWDVETGKAIITVGGHDNIVNDADWSPDGSYFATASQDSTVKIWEMETLRAQTALKGKKSHVLAVAWSPDGTEFAASGWHPWVTIWDSSSREIRREVKSSSGCHHLEWSVDGRRLVSLSQHGINLWETETWNPIESPDSDVRRVHSGSFSPDGEQLAWFSTRERSNLDDRVRVSKVVPSGSDSIRSFSWGWTYDLVWGSDSTRLFAVDSHAGFSQWDANTGHLISMFPNLKGHSLAISHDEARLAVGQLTGEILIADRRTGAVLKTMRGHTRRINSVDWSPDGTRLASASLDGTLKIWDPRLGQQALSISSGVSELHDVKWSPDGRKVLVGGNDSFIRVLDSGNPRVTTAGPAIPAHDLENDDPEVPAKPVPTLRRSSPTPTTASLSSPSGPEIAELFSSNRFRWTEPKEVELAMEGKLDEAYAPFVSRDGKDLYLTIWHHPFMRDICRFNWSEGTGPRSASPKLVDHQWLSGVFQSQQQDSRFSVTADSRLAAFASNRQGTFGKYDIWFCEPNEDELHFDELTHLGGPINSSFDDADPFLSADGLSLVFTSTRTIQRKQRSIGQHEIWLSERESLNEEFLEPRLLEISVNNNAAKYSPALSADGLLLLFEADASSAQRGLFYSVRASRNEPFGLAVQFAAPINSGKGDAEPMLSADGRTLYFCSRRGNKSGKLRLYVTNLVETNRP